MAPRQRKPWNSCTLIYRARSRPAIPETAKKPVSSPAQRPTPALSFRKLPIRGAGVRSGSPSTWATLDPAAVFEGNTLLRGGMDVETAMSQYLIE